MNESRIFNYFEITFWLSSLIPMQVDNEEGVEEMTQTKTGTNEYEVLVMVITQNQIEDQPNKVFSTELDWITTH